MCFIKLLNTRQNIYGFVIFNIVLLLYLINIKPFGYSYLYPLIPFNLKDLGNLIIHKPKIKTNSE